MLEGKQGVALLALMSNATVVPAYIQGTSPFSGMVSDFLKFNKITLYFGRPIRFDDLGGKRDEASREIAAKRIMDAIRGLQSDHPHRLILNVPNGDAIEDLGSTDVVEVPCHISREGARPITIGSLPENLRALTLAVKQYERLTIAAALGRDADKAAFALMANPIVGNWDAARQFVRRLGESDPQHFPTFQ